MAQRAFNGTTSILIDAWMLRKFLTALAEMVGRGRFRLFLQFRSGSASSNQAMNSLPGRDSELFGATRQLIARPVTGGWPDDFTDGVAMVTERCE
jgi:hypothetical protein